MSHMSNHGQYIYSHALNIKPILLEDLDGSFTSLFKYAFVVFKEFKSELNLLKKYPQRKGFFFQFVNNSIKWIQLFEYLVSSIRFLFFSGSKIIFWSHLSQTNETSFYLEFNNSSHDKKELIPSLLSQWAIAQEDFSSLYYT